MKNNGLPYLLIRNCVHFSGHANRAPVVHQFTEHKVDKEVWDPCILQHNFLKVVKKKKMLFRSPF